PGRPTQDYLARVVTRITFAGALFLAIVAVSPSVIALAIPDLATLGLGGTSLLIVVSVVVETMKQIEAQLMMRNYEGFIRSPRPWHDRDHPAVRPRGGEGDPGAG